MSQKQRSAVNERNLGLPVPPAPARGDPSKMLMPQTLLESALGPPLAQLGTRQEEGKDPASS